MEDAMLLPVRRAAPSPGQSMHGLVFQSWATAYTAGYTIQGGPWAQYLIGFGALQHLLLDFSHLLSQYM